MNANYIFSLIAVFILFVVSYVGTTVLGLQSLFGILIPMAAIIVFIVGFCYRVIGWARSPVPFRIPTTCGQQESLPGFKQARIDNPSTLWGVIARMFLEIFFFRSLFRNTRCEIHEGHKIAYKWQKWLWLGALAFHYAFLVVIIRHLRFFMDPVPMPIEMLEGLDGFFQVGLPIVQISGVLLLFAALFLFARRILIPQVKYISLPADYFPLFLIMGIAFTGILMRYFTRVDVVAVKELTMSLVSLSPAIPEGGLSPIFYVHLFFVCTLLVYFPFSKLMHAGGILMSPTRNMRTNSRAIRHVNPWNYPVKVHTYDEYEEEFREKMIEAGLPVEKE